MFSNNPCNSQFALLALIISIILSDYVVLSNNATAAMNGRKVILMSMDGFRHDYLTRTDTPNFDKLLKSGVSATYVNATFTTLTFPSHYTIVTGRYEESHGIVGNSMYDPKFNASFSMANNETRWWNEAEPIWINAVKAGLKVGSYFWVGSNVEIEGMRPTSWEKYNYKNSFESRVDKVIEWLTTDDYDMALVYFNEPDHSGHVYGPESPEMIPAIKRMDTLLGNFLNKLQTSGLKDKTDFILTSDHGMTTVLPTGRIYISDYANSSLVKRVVSGGALSHVIPQEGKAQELVDALSGVENITAYLKEDIPDHFHYRNNRRIMPVIILADEGYVVLANRNQKYPLNGTHGYSNEAMDMKTILMATGPSMASNKKTGVIRSVDIYPLLCHLLHIEPAPNNGSFERIKPFLNAGGDGSRNTATLISIITSSILALILSSH